MRIEKRGNSLIKFVVKWVGIYGEVIMRRIVNVKREGLKTEEDVIKWVGIDGEVIMKRIVKSDQ